MNEADLVGGQPCTEEFADETLAATTKLGRLGSNCQENLDRLAAQIIADTGRCSIGGIEAIFIVRDDGLVEERHACYFGDGSWTNLGKGKFMGCHKDTRAKPDPACTDPLPPPLDRFACHTLPSRPAVEKWNCTPLVEGQPYCASVGMPTRQRCPVRNECPGHKCREREACERLVVSGVPVWTFSGAGLAVTENPYVAEVPKDAPGTLTICDRSMTVCSTVTK
jgi:hypothetical protein